MNRGWPACRLLALLAVGWGLGGPAAPASAQQRPMDVEDLFAMQEFGDLALSPDGLWLAAVVKRPQGPGERYDIENMMRNEHADVWLVSVQGDHTPVNLTMGADDGSGYWSPVWSPDGRRLALLSTKGGDNVRLFVMDIGTRELVRLSALAVDPVTQIVADGTSAPVAWVDSVTVVTVLMPPGEYPDRFDSQRRTPRQATAAWARTHEGIEPAVSILESGLEDATEFDPAERLALIDVRTGDTHTAARARFVQITLDASRTRAAVIARTALVNPRPGTPLMLPHPIQSRFGIASLTAGESDARWIDDIQDPWRLVAFRPGAAAAQYAWSPDNGVVGVVGRHAQGQIHLVHENSSTSHVVRVPGIRVDGLVWTPDGQLLVRGASEEDAAGGSRRTDWWRVEEEGTGWRAEKVTGEMASVPQVLFAGHCPDRLLGLAGGDIWSLSVTGTAPINLTETVEEPIQRIISRPHAGTCLRGEATAVVRSAQVRQPSFHRLGLGASVARAERLETPHAAAELRLSSADGRTNVYTAGTPDGSFLWVDAVGRDSYVPRIALNTFLADVQDPHRMLLRYTSPAGDSLTALLALPPDRAPNERLPLVTWVYGGSMQRDTVSGNLLKDRSFYLNLNLLVAQGYAVLIPSLPLPPYGTPTEAREVFTDLTLAAVDRAIDMGIADPDRLAVMGYSYGGYTTMSLVGSTDRFRAAIAIAGPSELIGMYGTFDARLRYSDFPHHQLFGTAMTESGQMRVAGPPWADSERYLRNSPLMHVEKVETPIMLIYGDMDAVPIEQGEAFFIGLYRLGKRAAFVRYWGEGHGIFSPGNIRDAWTRMLGWLDEHLQPLEEPAA